MVPQEFLTQVVDSDFKWYDRKASLYRVLHILSRILIILISATIAVFAGVSFENKSIVIAILSSVIVVVTSISELMKFKEQWVEYRTTAELIKSERIFFETSTDPYDKADSFNVFVKNYETIKRSENQKWSSFIADKK